MKKLKSLEDFKKDGLLLDKSMKSAIIGGTEESRGGYSETYYFRDTMNPSGADCERCSRVDVGGQYLDDFFRCVEVAQGNTGGSSIGN